MGERDKYVEKLKLQLDKWNAELDKLEAKVRESRVDAKIGYEEQINALRQHRDKVKVKIAEIQGASEDAWGDLKQGLDNTWTAFKEGVEKAKSRFKQHSGNTSQGRTSDSGSK